MRRCRSFSVVVGIHISSQGRSHLLSVVSLSLILFKYGDDAGGLHCIICPIQAPAVLSYERMNIYIVSGVLLIMTHAIMIIHVLLDVMGGS